MLSFTCQACGQLVFFENTACLRCGSLLGFLPDRHALAALQPVWGAPGCYSPVTTAPARPPGPSYRRCANEARAGCNWMVPADEPRPLCDCCALTRTRPNEDDQAGADAFRAAEAAKRRLVFQLHELDLPIISRAEDPDAGLAFDLLSSRDAKVVTGHDNGLITLDLSESDDVHREQLRQQLGEPYRTVLGHFRHEVGHYYWPVLVSDAGPAPLHDYRELFGDERVDYGESLTRHYRQGPPPDWAERYVSSYATMHPWEDWAETFAHYLHICDTLQTAAEYGLHLAAPSPGSLADGSTPGSRAPIAPVDQRPDADDPDAGRAPWREPFDRVIDRWLPLSYALNAVNRSMGREDLYPFVLAPTIIAKLAFVHERARWAAHSAPRHAAVREAAFRSLPRLDHSGVPGRSGGS